MQQCNVEAWAEVDECHGEVGVGEKRVRTGYKKEEWNKKYHQCRHTYLYSRLVMVLGKLVLPLGPPIGQSDEILFPFM